MLNELTIQDIIIIFLKRWWLLLIGLIIGGTIAFLYTEYFIDPVFTSRGSLYVNNKNTSAITPNNTTNINDLTVAAKLVDTYKVILKSDRFISIIKQQSHLNYSIDELKRMISMQGVENTEVLEVVVTTKNPNQSQLIAQTILSNAKDEIIRVVEAGNVKIVDDANLPYLPSAPNKRTNTALGLILGLIAAVALIILAEMMDSTIKDEDDLERNYDIPIVGCIPNLGEMQSSQQSYGYAKSTKEEVTGNDK